MKPAPFDYHAPSTTDEALELLQRYGPEAKPLAGGQSLVPAMNFRLAQPGVLVDLNRITDLAGIHTGDGGSLRIGAMTRQRALERSHLVTTRAPLLAEAMPHVAHPPIRNRGTAGGSLAHADPASELPAVMTALGARFRLRSREGERWIPAADFFFGLFATALEPGELLVEIEIPAPAPRTGFAFMEIARRHGDYALAGIAARLELDPAGRCSDVRMVLFGVGEGPVSVAAAEALVRGESPSEEVFAAAAALVERALDPPGDIHATSAYRRRLAGVLTRRALARAVRRADGLTGERTGGRLD
ncbi:MAG TPA: xanthine dehydrogenase family protein subunit M [Gemmatimonadales bacterium]